MQRMVRKQVYITGQQNSKLKSAARRRGVTEADVVRESLDQALDEGSLEGRAEAIDYLSNLFERVAEVAGLTTADARPWTREDAYEERLRRYS